MTVQTINVGARVNDETAETVYSAFTKTNSNFSDLDTRVSSAESTVATLSADMTELQGLFGTDVEAATFTTKRNDLAVAAGTRILRWNGAGTTGITGIAAPASARVLTIVNASTDYLLWLENENTASAAANRLMLPDGFPAFLMPGDTITLFYDLTTARWRVLSWPTRGMGMGFDIVCDASVSRLGFEGSSSGTGAGQGLVASNWTNEKAHGIGYVQTGTSGAGRAFIGSAGQANFIPGHGCALFAARVGPRAALPTGADTFAGWCGFSDGYDGTVDNAAAWELRWNGSTAELSQTVVSASSVTRRTTGSPTLSTTRLDVLGVFINKTATRADFIYSIDQINVELAGAVSSGLPAVSTGGILGACLGVIHSAGANSRYWYFDWIGVRYNGLRA